jgi:hypothetical protein
MDRNTNDADTHPTEPTPMDELPDKPSQAEGDVGDDEVSEGA